MQSPILSTLHQVIAAEISRGKVIEVDAFCRMFMPLCPTLTQRQLQDEIILVVASYGGVAAWGSEDPLAKEDKEGLSPAGQAEARLRIGD